MGTDSARERASSDRHHVWNRLKRAVQRRWQRRLAAKHSGEALTVDDFDPASVRQALIILPNWRMGNLLLTTPVAEWLRRGLLAKGARDPQIDLCSGGDFAALLQGNPHIRRHLPIPRAIRPLARRALRAELAGAGYDLVYVAHYTGSPLASRLALATGARLRVGAGRANVGPLNLVVERPPRRDNITDQHRAVLERLGLAPDPSVEICMVSTPEELDEARRTIAQWDLGEGRRPLGLFVVGHRIKQMPLAHWAAIIARLRADFPALEPVVFHGAKDTAKIRRLQRALGARPVRAVAAPLRQFCALVEQLAAVVTCDCGPMHLARAKRRPLVSLFTRDNFDRFAPRGPGRVCLYAPPPGPAPADVSAALRGVLEPDVQLRLQPPPEVTPAQFSRPARPCSSE